MRDLKNIFDRDYKNEFDQRDNVHILFLFPIFNFVKS
jgi:hypothetical protein